MNILTGIPSVWTGFAFVIKLVNIILCVFEFSEYHYFMPYLMFFATVYFYFHCLSLA